jgi:pimeloyl-ACP methyl ester carboxylesterase
MSRIGWNIVLFAFPLALGAQGVVRDTSPHVQRFINVEPSVRLEVLDWGGSGRPIILLAGRGNTAHIFDDFASKLTGEYHVYGITRRGFGNSTRATSGFRADSLGDDVLAVIDSLGTRQPVLIGHSIAGQELSSIGSRYPERVAGLVYLDAGFHFAFYDSSAGRAPVFFRDTQRKLAQLTDLASAMTLRERDALIQELLRRLPILERDLREWRQDIAVVRDQSRILPPPDSNPVHRALAMGQQIYTSVRAPVLAIFALPTEIPPGLAGDSASRARFDSMSVAAQSPQINAFERGIPSARVVRIPHANHYVFRSHEADVLREIRAFIAGLPGTVAEAPAATACGLDRADSFTYIVDGRPATCISAMALPRSRIASVEVLKGAAAASRYPGSDAQGVIVIQTKRNP